MTTVQPNEYRMTLANKITLVRLISIPIFIITLIQEVPLWPVVIFAFSAVTDVLDGAVARMRGERTVLGSFLDPLADKLLMVSTFLALAHLKLVPMWVFVIVFSRDLLIFLGWNIIYIMTQNAAIEPRWLGKLSTGTQMITVIFFLVTPLRAFAPGFVWVMIALTMLSMVDYVWVGAKRLSQLN